MVNEGALRYKKTEFEVSGNQSRLYSAYSALHDAITIGSEKISSPLTILMCIDG